MVYTDYIKQQILYHYHQNKYKAPTIAEVLREESLKVCCVGVAKFLKLYKGSSSIARKPGSGRPSKITVEVKKIVEEQMQLDDEMAVHQLHQLLVSKGFNISKDGSQVSYIARLDFSRIGLLPIYKGGQQGYAIAMGFRKPRFEL